MEGQREGRPAAGETRRVGCKTTGAPVKRLRCFPGAGHLPPAVENEDRMRRRAVATGVANAPVDKSIAEHYAMQDRAT